MHSSSTQMETAVSGSPFLCFFDDSMKAGGRAAREVDSQREGIVIQAAIYMSRRE
jgi:hypothetical protein